jgi:hypothetical protein
MAATSRRIHSLRQNNGSLDACVIHEQTQQRVAEYYRLQNSCVFFSSLFSQRGRSGDPPPLDFQR